MSGFPDHARCLLAAATTDGDFEALPSFGDVIDKFLNSVVYSTDMLFLYSILISSACHQHDDDS
jgi:hypothetical protein